MPEYDDLLQAPLFRSQLEYSSVNVIDRYTVLLRDGETTATIYPIHQVEDMPPGLLLFLCDEFNMEIDRGDTVPFFELLHVEQFQAYWFSHFAGVMVLGDLQTLQGVREWEKECLGTFFIKPNYPGRASHICAGGFLVNAGIRGKGIGRTLADCYLQWAPRLGYTYSMFNLVFETNVAARRIWESLNFKRVGRIKAAGILKGQDAAVDGIIYGRELISSNDSSVGGYRFDKIRYYLETGKYPAMADRLEKSRLRSSASHYKLVDGKLMLRGKEVVSDPIRQLQICNEVHATSHGGINKTTSVITEKYHWTRIKDTVATAIKNCPDCRGDAPKDPPIAKRPVPKKIPNNNSKLMRSVRATKMIHTQPNNPNARHLMGSNPAQQDDVEAMVTAEIQQRHDQRNVDDLLTHDLTFNDNIYAAVVQVQRDHEQHQQDQNAQQQRDVEARRVQQQPQLLLHPSNPRNHHGGLSQLQIQPQGYANEPSDSVSHEPNQFHPYNSYNNAFAHANANQSKPSDSLVVDSEYHSNGGDEIEIARALIQANEDVNHHHGSKDDSSSNNNLDLQ